MTTRDFCKHLAEVDNSLKLRRESLVFGKDDFTTAMKSNDKQFATSDRSQRALDCATGLPPSGVEPANPNSSSYEPTSASAAAAAPVATTTTNTTTATSSSSSSPLPSALGAESTLFGSTEHVYPNGWLPVMESFKVKPGTIEKAIILGRDVIITRSSEGEVSVLDAYCPHMGVHIGVGGRVIEVDNQSCVQCPFHGWAFSARDGQCAMIPYSKSKCNIPKQAKLNTWQCIEVDNFIYVWHHIDGQPPSWYLTPSKELESLDWILAGRSCHKTNLEIRDMHENGADMNHFEGIHNDLFVFGGEFLKVQAFNHLQQYFRHNWSPDWRPVLDETGKMTHMAEMNLNSWISVLKVRIFDIKVRATQIGPACVNLRYTSDWYGSGLLKMNAIPLGGRRTMYVQHIYTKPSYFNWFMAKWVLFGEIMQVSYLPQVDPFLMSITCHVTQTNLYNLKTLKLERDLFIWNHKKNIKYPVFVSEDKILKRFRMWYGQFYKRKRQISIVDEKKESEIGKNKVKIHNNDNIDF